MTPARKLSDFSEFQAAASLTKELPYWDLEDQVMILADGTMASAFQITGVALETWDENRINQWCLDIRSVLSSLPDKIEVSFNFEIQKCDVEIVNRHQDLVKNGVNENIKWVCKDRTTQLKRAIDTQQIFAPIITLVIYQRGLSASTDNHFIKKLFRKPETFKQMSSEAYQENLTSLKQNCEGFLEQLKSLGLAGRPLSDQEVIKKLVYFFNPKRNTDLKLPQINKEYRSEEFYSSEKEMIPDLTTPSLREQVNFNDLVVDYDFLYLDGLYHRIISLKTLPEFTYAAMINKLLESNFPIEIQLHIKVPEQSKELASLHSRRRMAHSMSVTETGKISDLESEAKLASTEELLRALIETGQKIFYFQFCVLLRASSKAELEKKSKMVLAKFQELNRAVAMAETVGAFKIFKTLLPLGNTTMIRSKRVKTSNLADFLPLYQPFSGTSDPVCLFRNRSGGLVRYNPFDAGLPNYNALVTGSSGAGKSFLNNLILMQYLGQKPLLYIIDVGGSYKKLCEFLNGQYVELSPPRDGQADFLTINPFQVSSGGHKPSAQKIKFLISFFESILGEEQKLSKFDKSILEQQIESLYKDFLGKKAMPTLSDLAKKFATQPEFKKFSQLLYPWQAPQTYGRLLDGQQKLNLNSEVVVFDLKGLAQYPDLQAVMILILTDFILGEVESPKNLNRPKQIIMDEAWEHLKNPAASLFMEYCVRTLRKSGSGITFITQGLEEIVQSPIGSAILSNTASKFILLQRGNLDPIRKILKLNDQEMRLIASLKQNKGHYSEAFMMANEDRALIRLLPTALEYWLATSDALDNQKLAEMRQENPEQTLSQILYELSLQYPFGVSQKGGKNA